MFADDETRVPVSELTISDPFFVPAGPQFDVRFGAATHVGHVRPQNEDQFAVVRRRRMSDVLMSSLPSGDWDSAEDSVWLAMVADGMGGHAAGDVASRLALQSILELSSQASSWVMRLSDPEAPEIWQRVNAYLARLRQTFQDHVARQPASSGMGTTLTVANLMPPDAVIAHIGDSRAYLWRDQHLVQLTRDQTVAQDLIDSGAEPVSVRSFRRMLTNSLNAGVGATRVDLLHTELQAGDRLMLCSDGLSDLVEHAEIASALAADDPQAAVDTLVERALSAGGRDNITVVVGRILPS